jgi:FixJ family two-component response regulator
VGEELRNLHFRTFTHPVLSPREREIVIQIARGRLSKQVAHDIGIAEATVKEHRSSAMQKMEAGSLPELGRTADKLKLVPDTPQRP